MNEFVLATFITAVGLCVAGAGTHLYQWLLREPAHLRYDGKTAVSSLGHVIMSFVCGPYILLQMGWQQEDDGTVALGSALLSAFVAFGWSFITDLFVMSLYVALRY